jgi:hypothetical protein
MIGDQAAASALCGQRILPSPGKSGEIAVCRAQDQPVLDGQRREIGIVD